MQRQSPKGRGFPSLPTGSEVASYRNYEDATKALEVLSAADFPMQSVSVVGTDLHVVERIRSKLTPAKVALTGAGQGLTWGILMALMVMVFSETYTPLIPMLAIAAGVGMGIVLAMVSWVGPRGRRSFAAESQLVATRYAVLVSEQTQRAYGLLQGTSGNQNVGARRRTPRSESSQSAPTRPTEFGSRPDEQPRFGVRRADIEAAGSGTAPEEAASSAETQDPEPAAEE